MSETLREKFGLPTDRPTRKEAGREWIPLPHTAIRSQGSSHWINASNYDALERDFEEHPDVMFRTGTGVWVAADTTDPDVQDAYDILQNQYPIYDEDHAYELRDRREWEAWNDHVASYFAVALDTRFPAVREALELSDGRKPHFLRTTSGSQFSGYYPGLFTKEELWGLFNTTSPSWRHDTEGESVDVDVAADRLEEEPGPLGRAFFGDRAFEARRAMAEFLGLEYVGEEELFDIVAALYDEGFQPRNGLGDPSSRMQDDARIEQWADWLGSDPEAETRYINLAENWIALVTLRDRAEEEAEEGGDEGLAAFLREIKPLLTASNIVDCAYEIGLVSNNSEGRPPRPRTPF